ncbi:11147_t:CDS:2 [Gigaspora margarita]|uniref:11147_t:CDS:1 n=1 Tax=Gigaspora margarita TaxID=4874 RepID=A0ABN7UST2_GIGMA|nr:11147_t:CDS:2 [Gigaspora margarita]
MRISPSKSVNLEDIREISTTTQKIVVNYFYRIFDVALASAIFNNKVRLVHVSHANELKEQSSHGCALVALI